VSSAAGVAANVAACGESLFAADFAMNGVANGDRMDLSVTIAATKVAARGDSTAVLWWDSPELAAMSCFNALGEFILLYMSRMGVDVVGWCNALRFEGEL
jgi:hypothetical protein